MTGTDLHHWIALRRVHDGKVTRRGDRWRDRGHPVPGYVTDALDELLMVGLVILADPVEGVVRAALTNGGTARLEQLTPGSP